jgi:putative membrane protein
VVSTIVAEHLLLKDQMSRAEIKRVSVVDGVYGFSAISVLTMGLILWLVVGKPSEFYTSNWIFHLKVSLFITVGLISISPTIFFLKQRKGDQSEIVTIPKRIKMLIRLELAILFIIPLLAGLMAHGVGSFK